MVTDLKLSGNNNAHDDKEHKRWFLALEKKRWCGEAVKNLLKHLVR